MRGQRHKRYAAALLALALASGTSSAAFAADGPSDIIVTVPGPSSTAAPDGAISDAELRWGLNPESGAGAFAGGCNFLSAGRAGDAGGSRVWQESDGLYRSQEGSVRIKKPAADGQWVEATWAGRCLDARGTAVSAASTTSTSGNQVVMQGGTGSLENGEVHIKWAGSFTVVFYGGMTYWSVTDPELSLDSTGSGALTGVASGYGTSMEDMTKWQLIDPETITLADIRGADLGSAGGFSITPQYLGVQSTGSGQVARTATNEAHWGAFPQSFLDFHQRTGQQGYWVTTGGVRDAAKPASPLTVSYSASAPISPPEAGGGTAAEVPMPNNPVLRAPASIPANIPAAQLVAMNAPQTLLPQTAGLVPNASGAMPAIILPLLISATSISLAIIAVLSMMRALPWSARSSYV